MNNTPIIALLVATLLIGAVLFLSVERSAGPESTAPSESTHIAPLIPSSEEPALRVATMEDLAQYPNVAPEEGLPEQPLYAVRLPESELAVVLRPLTEEEYGSFQVQAIGYEIIERQMLAAALVHPAVDEADVVSFPSELITFFQQKVNEISGFEVF